MRGPGLAAVELLEARVKRLELALHLHAAGVGVISGTLWRAGEGPGATMGARADIVGHMSGEREERGEVGGVMGIDRVLLRAESLERLALAAVAV